MNYINATTPVEIICKEHGSFFQAPTTHLKGCGCTPCSISSQKSLVTDTTEEFLAKCNSLAERNYDYSLVDYKSATERVKIICPAHGVFEQTPTSHLKGHGCLSCARSGYDPKKPGFLYVLKCDDLTKIGITNLSAQERARSVSKSYGKKFEVLLFIKFQDGNIPDTVETELLKELRESHDKPQAKFDGSTETFLGVDYEKLLLRITHFVGAFSTNKIQN